MRRMWIRVLCLTILMALVAGDVTAAKKSRSNKSPARARANKGGKNKRNSTKLSRRESQIRGRVDVRGKRGRYARSRRGRRRTQYAQAVADPVAPRTSSGISPERATEIQNALIKAGYLDPPASGQYDDATIEAMKQFQAANRLPTTGLPSAPLLKKLGVPKRSNDGYAVPVKSVSESDRKHPPQ